MEKASSASQPTKPYFQVARPAHFKTRLDLIEELCVPDALMRILPTTQPQYEKWLKTFGLVAEGQSFAKVQSFAHRGYEFTDRYVLKNIVPPGRDRATSVVVDERHWPSWCESGGLFSSIINRAVEAAMCHGMKEANARALFRPNLPDAPIDKCSEPEWGVGYERSTGLCVILALTKGETQRIYLEKKFGYFAPFQIGA